MKKILIVFILAIAVLFGYAAMQPSEYNISREIQIQAEPQQLFPLINSSQAMQTWMPWKEMDSQMSVSYSGSEYGVGSVATWESKGDMGNGSSTIIESLENEKTVSELKYFSPHEMSQIAELRIVPMGDVSKVVWSVKGNNDLMGKLFFLFVDIDKMVGDSFEKGLEKLKQTIEANQLPSSTQKEALEEGDLEEQPMHSEDEEG